MAKSQSKSKSLNPAPVGAKGKKTTNVAAKKAATALKAVNAKKAPAKTTTAKKAVAKKTIAKKAAVAKTPVTAKKKSTATPKARKKPGPKPGTKHGAVTAAGKPRRKPGPKAGSKRSAITAAGKPRQKPGPKPKAKTVTLKKPVVAKKTPPKKVAAKKAVSKKVTPKKVAVKKLIAKKPLVAKKPVKQSVSKKVAPQNVAAKKSVAVKEPVATKSAVPAVKAAAQAPSQTPAATAPVAKIATTSAPLQTSANELLALKARIDGVQARMKLADNETRQSVRTLEKAFKGLEAKVGKNQGSDTDGLSRQVALLSQKLATISDSASADVNASLTDALRNPTSSALTLALTNAEKRLSAAETEQASAIAKINRHIADMAMAIDNRFRKESETRKSAISDVRRETFQRIRAVETESARAIQGLGEKVVALGEMRQRPDNSETVIKEKVSELALKTQEEFEQYRANLERRLESLVGEQRQTLAATDQALLGITSRLDGLEFIAGQAENSPIPAPAPIAAYPEVPAPSEASSILNDTLDPDVQSYTPAPIEDDPFAPDPITDSSSAIVPPNPYAIPEPAPEIAPLAEHIPAEYSPETSFSGNDQIPAPQIPAPMAASAIPTPAPLIATSALAAPAPSLEDTMLAPIPDQIAPYADPAYAEGHSGFDTSMSQARPGNFGTEKKQFALPNLSNISTRNMKIAAAVVAVSAMSLIGVKVLTGSPDKTSAPVNVMADNSTTSPLGAFQPIAAPAMAETRVLETAPTIGQYQDNTASVAPMGSDAAVTLEAAADTGNPVAQYQLGLTLLSNGRTEDAVQLIRSAADQGQPAAQYRLAKLYETGEGVTLNAEMARQLTERAARSGNRIAMHDLALYHAEGRGGVKMDLDTAAKWFEKAAQRGVVDSQFNLGVMYETGKGVPKNLTDAFVWYSIAGVQGDQFAKQRVDILKNKLSGDILAAADARIAKFSPSKIDKAANGIFTDLPWGGQKKAAPTTDPRIQQVQSMLMDLGFDTGGADGAIGPKTRTAIMNFEKSNGLPETGRVNDELVDKLEFASGA